MGEARASRCVGPSPSTRGGATEPLPKNFTDWKADEQHTYESIFLFGMGMYLCIVIALKVTPSSVNPNWAPIVSSGSGLLLHFGSRTLYYRTPRPRWLLCSILLVDCLLVTCTNVYVQGACLDMTHGLLGRSYWDSPYLTQLDSFQTSFIFFIMLSYVSNFLLLYREAVAVVICAVMMYFSVVFASRLMSLGSFQEGVAGKLSHIIFECALMVSGCLLTLVAHRSCERSERRLFEVLRERQELMFQEKILRCSAEFRMEAMKDAAQCANGGSAAGDAAQHRPSSSAPPHSEAGHSVPSKAWSAPGGLPGALRSFLQEAVAWGAADAEAAGECCADGMDCLPRDATVWVEGEQAPRALWQLGTGQRVLCHDVLANAARFVDVESVEEDSQAVDWVDVELVDGTKLTMTADHPVQVVRQKGAQQHSVVKAERLEAEQHKVVVYRAVTQPVEVRRVSTVAPEVEQPQGRVSVTVKQSARHSILVAATPGDGLTPMDFRFMAVGSADLALSQVDVRSAFVNVHGPPLSPTHSARSCPPSTKRPAASFASPSLSAMRPGDAGAEQPSGGSSSKGRSSSSGPTLPSSLSETPSDCSVQLPTSGGQGVRLSHLLQVRRQVLPSMGSRDHAWGACRPCRYDYQGRCERGAQCHLCHSPHYKVRGHLKPVLADADRSSDFAARGGVRG